MFDKINLISKGKWRLDNVEMRTRFVLLMQGTGDELEATVFSIFQNYLIKFFRRRNLNMEELSAQGSAVL